MFIRCWGSRGSISVSGEEYIRYGGSTTCMEIRSANDDLVIIDAGTGIRRLGNMMLKEKRKQAALFFTHAHWDHLMGFPFFKLIYQKDVTLTIYGCPLEHGGMKKLLSGLMAPPYFPVPLKEIHAKVEWKESCSVDAVTETCGMKISCIPLNHPNSGLGYRFEEDGKSFVFLTDNELDGDHHGGRSYEEYVDFCKGADLLIHDAEFTDKEYGFTRGWGHSTWRRALQLAMDADVKQFGLFHHNQDHSDDMLDDIVLSCRKIIAEQGGTMHCFGTRQGTEIDI